MDTGIQASQRSFDWGSVSSNRGLDFKIKMNLPLFVVRIYQELGIRKIEISTLSEISFI